MQYIQKIKVGNMTTSDILNEVDRFLSKKNKTAFHVVNQNPETFVFAYTDAEYRRINNHADALLLDGIGIKWLANILQIKSGEKLAGTDLMAKLINYASTNLKRVLLLGG